MNYIGKFISNFKEAYNEINAATLTGAIDVIVVRQPDGSFTSSPFHVRFGKIGVLRSREKVVDIEINGEPIDIHMKLGENGEAFFVEELEDEEELEEESFLGTSPLPSFIMNYPDLQREDDVKSQDSGVGAEEVISKALKVKQDNQLEEAQILKPGDDKTYDKSMVGVTPEELAASLSKIESSTHSIKDSEPVTFLTGQEAEDLLSQQQESSRECSTEPENYGEDCKGGTKRKEYSVHRRTKEIPMSKLSTHSPRSKSLTNEAALLNSENDLTSNQGFRTDVEDVTKTTKKGNNATSRRKKKKKITSNKKRRQAFDSQSSDNSSTPEGADVSSSSLTNPRLLQHNIGDQIFVMDDIEYDNSLPSKKRNISVGSKRIDCSLDLAGTVPCRGDSRASISFLPDFHPFSDTDISPSSSPHKGRSRSNTPVKSDTEYEFEKQKSVREGASRRDSKDNKWSWTWGQLPTPPVGQRSVPSSRQSFAVPVNAVADTEPVSNSQVDEAQRSMLSNMFNFMRATKKARHNPESEGIYLDDLNLDELDPEVAALYFPRNSHLLLEKQTVDESVPDFVSVLKDDDIESGNGTSLPHSPHSVEGAIGCPKYSSVYSDFDDTSRHPIFDFRDYHDIAFSLCGKLHEHDDTPFPESLFMQNLVTYDDFCENPGRILDNPDLVVRVGGQFYNWSTASPMIMSLVLFQMPLPKKVKSELISENMPKKEIRKRSQSKGYSWFLWGRSPNSTNPTKGDSNAVPDDVKAASLSTSNQNCDANLAVTSSNSSAMAGSVSQSSVEQGIIDSVSSKNSSTTVESQSISTVHDLQKVEVEDTVKVAEVDNNWDSFEYDKNSSKFRRCKKSIRLSSEQISKLNLRAGINEVVFSVTTAYQGTTRCKCHIFLWHYDEKIIISDIDGTITKSDVLGHILPIIGKDWAQGGVAQLYTKIKNNGYNFLYLSARAIGQARITRDFLRSVKQGDISLPNGPLLLNPTSLIHAFHREVIERKPEEFKISCLKDIKALFPPDENPFYAGYGNRINDVWAYSAVGIPIHRIFTINYKGELKHELTQAFQTTYFNMSDIVNHMFPYSKDMDLLDEYTALKFWRNPLPDISLEIEDVSKTS